MVDRPEGPTLTKTYGQRKKERTNSWIQVKRNWDKK